MYSLDDFLLDLRNRGENTPLNNINNVMNPTQEPQLQGDIAKELCINKLYNYFV